MRIAIAVALIALVLIVGLPLAMGMGDMGSCPSCGPGDAPVAAAMCLAVLSLFVLNVLFQSRSLAQTEKGMRVLLLGDPPDKPPRLS
jgi:hypothetical protein